MAGLALANVDKVLSEVDWAVGKLKEELSMEGTRNNGAGGLPSYAIMAVRIALRIAIQGSRLLYRSVFLRAEGASQSADVRNIESKIMHRMTMVSEFLVELSQVCRVFMSGFRRAFRPGRHCHLRYLNCKKLNHSVPCMKTDLPARPHEGESR